MIKNANNKKKKRGFTLIELIIVIAIIAILAAIAIPKFGQIRQDANVKSDIANAKTIANAATSLVAEGSIDVDTTKNKVLTLDGDAEETDADKIEGYLQSIPTVKSEDGSFTVTITQKGDVIVKGGNKEFFPEVKDATKTQ